MSKRVILIGGSSRDSDRIKATDAEVWSCNNLYNLCTALELSPTRWFEIHDIQRSSKGIYSRRSVTTIGDGSTINDYLLHLKSLKIPIYMQKHWPIIPKSIPYPIVDVLSLFRRGYFTNSFAYMMALAIMEKFDEIELYGLCTQTESFREYYVHRISTEYLIGHAEARGIKVTIGHRSDLLKTTYLYGYQEEPGNYEKWQEWYASSAHLLTTDAYNMWRM